METGRQINRVMNEEELNNLVIEGLSGSGAENYDILLDRLVRTSRLGSLVLTQAIRRVCEIDFDRRIANIKPQTPSDFTSEE